MLTITPAAGDRLLRMLNHAPDHIVVRIVFGFRGLGFQYSVICPGDSTFSHEGKPVLVLNQHLADALREKTLEMRQTDEGMTLDLA